MTTRFFLRSAHARRARSAFCAAWLSVVPTGCRSPTALDPAEHTAIVAEVTAATRAFEAAERARDAEAVLAHLAPGFYIYVDGTRVDHDAIAEQIRATMPALRRFDTAFHDIEVHVFGPDGAVASFVFHDAVTDASGVTTRQRGATTLAWRRLDGEWRIVYAHADHHPDEEP